MENNSFYKFATKNKLRFCSDCRRTDCNIETTFDEFDRVFYGSKAHVISKDFLDFFDSFNTEIFIKKNHAKLLDIFSKEFKKSFVLPDGGFMIEFTKNKKQLYIVTSSYDYLKRPELVSIHDILGINSQRFYLDGTFTFDFEDDLKDSYNNHCSLSAYTIALFIGFYEIYEDYNI
jgi:hypothetical protein